jgi:site-specific DNA recombinase
VRVIVAARLSVLAEGQTGLDTQEQEVIRWAQAQGHTVVGVAADFKTGKSDLTDRPNLRPWITDPVKRDSYDAIVAYKVDRLTRADKAGTTRGL